MTPRWLDTGDRFWYSFQTREGRRFYLVDPVKKSRAPLFDHAKMAAALTTITRIPYDAQNLPFSTVRFVKKDTAFEFNFQVPASAVIPSTKPREVTTEQQGETRGRDDLNDAAVDPQQQGGRQGGRGGRGASGDAPAPPRNKTLYFEYRHGDGAGDPPRGPQAGAAAVALGVDVTGQQDGALRAQSQPLHDGR